MSKLTVTIAPEIIQAFPAIAVAGVRVSIPVASRLAPVIDDELSERAKSVVAEIEKVDPITSLPQVACWREAYSKIGGSSHRSFIQVSRHCCAA